ncbi:6-phosphogluconate dehydrogenase Gnd [Agromyces rhizosphaerae]|uniref:6-phosphogluconate dehydrogenase Gnd n=1 Tax=Agromyces rhizosphaerae TaxID=88374 RepID=A0A9W6CVG6_9MICO|nr:decarboxylating 6-phosphogluconate dehydrogenase [Agromyces rhizosphaerae]GLI27237.1 6-phosphogluconate dehydrogenase Gnd [Agromyces rhizosphaerae]
MHIGIIGLGRMGANMRSRLRQHDIDVTGYDTNPAVSDVGSLAELVEVLPAPRVVWVMVPSGPVTDGVVADLADLLDAGDLVINGGNSRYTDDLAYGETLGAGGVRFVDAGVSGGVWGDRYGYGLMVGGADEDVERAMPVFDALRPEGPREEGFSHVGPVAAGHYAKMVHNGVEYALMQAYAEGYELLAKRTDLVTDVEATFAGWQRGTVVRSWLLELLVRALQQDPELDEIKGYVEDSGEGRWTVDEAIDQAVPVPTIAAAIFARFVSRQDDSPAMRAVASLRNQFGGHAVKPAEE